MNQIPRRRFLQILGSAAVWSVFGACGEMAKKKIWSRSGHALGTTVKLRVIHEDGMVASAALAEAFAGLDQIEEDVSLYRDSALTRLNARGSLENPPVHLVRILSAALVMAELSAGSFDPTVQTLWELWAAAARRGRAPSPGDLTSARELVDWRRVSFSGKKITLGSEQKLTLNGIAQGAATDLVMKIFQDYGIENALIESGEVGTLGSDAEGPWHLGIQHPRHPEAWLATLVADGRCVATSGDYATRLSKKVHHIFDPRTGQSATSFQSVTVLAPTGVLADALSTAIFAMGEPGGELLESLENVDAVMVDQTGRVRRTSGVTLI